MDSSRRSYQSELTQDNLYELRKISKSAAEMYKRYKLYSTVLYIFYTGLNLFITIFSPLFVILDSFRLANVIITTSVLGFINNVVLNVSGISKEFEIKAERSYKLELAIIKNSKPNLRFYRTCKLEYEKIQESFFSFFKICRRKKNSRLSLKGVKRRTSEYFNVASTAPEMYEMDRFAYNMLEFQ